MLKPYRCQNENCSEDPHGRTIYDFWAEQGVCPKCGASEKDPKSARFIQRLVVIHFDPPSPWPGKGLNVQACNPQRPVGREPASGDPTVINCPLCKETEVWKQAAANWDWEVITDTNPEKAQQVREAIARQASRVGVPKRSTVTG